MIITDNAEYIWRWLWERIGNDYGVAGLMGNLCAESGLNPKNLQNSYEQLLGYTDQTYTEAVDSGVYTEAEFVADRAAFGIAQWTARERKQALFDFAKLKGASIGDLEMQLGFLWTELGRGYKSVLDTLILAKNVRDASDAVMLKYEIPADTSENNRASRADLGMMYYERYAVGALAKNEKADTIVRLATERIGRCRYVLGAIGTYGKDGVQEFDCRGFTWWLLHQVGVEISKVGATTQYNTAADWTERGLTGVMPNLVCPVFKYRASDGKMAHTGMHIGDGVVIHCTSNGGVKYGDLSDTTWTNYAIPKGLYTAEEIEHARGRELVRTLKTGCSGEDVKRLQETLNGLGFSCGKADGIFGAKTKTAVMAFQSAYGLTADGIVGAKTRDKLEEVTGQTGGDETEEDKTDTTENQETPVLPENIGTPTKDVLHIMKVWCDQLGLKIVDARSGNICDIDFM